MKIAGLGLATLIIVVALGPGVAAAPSAFDGTGTSR